MDGTIKVSYEVLRTKSEEVLNYITKLTDQFSEMKTLMDGTQSYWIGEAGTTHRNNYQKKQPDVENALNRLKEHVTDLRSIAGIYESVEKNIVSDVNTLTSHVID